MQLFVALILIFIIKIHFLPDNALRSRAAEARNRARLLRLRYEKSRVSLHGILRKHLIVSENS